MNTSASTPPGWVNHVISLLESHDKLAGWAQFLGAMLALVVAVAFPLILQWTTTRKLEKIKAKRSADLKVLALTNISTMWFALHDVHALLDQDGRVPEHEAQVHIRRVEESRLPLLSFPLWEIEDIQLGLVMSEVARLSSLVAVTMSRPGANCRPVIEQSQANITGMFNVLTGNKYTSPQFHGPNSEFMRARARAYAQHDATAAPAAPTAATATATADASHTH